ncbi:MAG: hypothetical protein ACI9ON_003456, partial [Limisphaerales bacterium]
MLLPKGHFLSMGSHKAFDLELNIAPLNLSRTQKKDLAS